jgi:hypothetical protein
MIFSKNAKEFLWKNRREDKPIGLLERRWAHYGPMGVKVKERGGKSKWKCLIPSSGGETSLRVI